MPHDSLSTHTQNLNKEKDQKKKEEEEEEGNRKTNRECPCDAPLVFLPSKLHMK
jgi:hypothetical protein